MTVMMLSVNTDFVIDINEFIGTLNTVLPYTDAYYLRYGYHEHKLNSKLIDEVSNKIHTSTEDD